MKALLEKIRKLLKDRRFRRTWYRFVSGFAAVVVFITTYALVLPAITLEKTAACGIEEHQHDESCYESKLVCGQEESEGHQHDDSCYTVTQELVCGLEEHQHSVENGCYDEQGNLICEISGHAHGDSCYKEMRTLTCGQEASEGHHHTEACYDEVLVCGKEAHIHSAECFKEDSSAVAATDEAAAGASTATSGESDSASSNAMPEETMEDGTAGMTEETAVSDPSVSQLDPVDLDIMMTKDTGFYYFHAEDDKEIPANSAEITDWQKVGKDTKLASTDLVKAYLTYKIPAGSLNESNPVARYRLPENIHLTDDQIEAINKTENGVYTSMNQEPDSLRYLGAEAVEGDRKPDEELVDGVQEYISAVVRAENVFDEEGQYLGQDLIFTFVPYTIEKNQNTYDTDGSQLTAGEKITGWFACDFNMSQIDWVEEETDSDNKAAEDDKASGDKSEELEKSEDSGESEELEKSKGLEETEKIEEPDKSEESERRLEETEKSAEVVFVEEDREIGTEEISTVLKLVETKQTDEDTADTGETENVEYKSGTLTADGDGYKITLDYTEEAQIPENAELSVTEITPETDREAYEACLEQAKKQVTGEDKSTVDQTASRFFDIEIIVRNTGGDEIESFRKIEPAAPVSVNIQLLDESESADPASGTDKTEQNDPTVLHFAEDGVEQIDSTVRESQAERNGEGQNTQHTEVEFEAESFSIYGVVYTVDFSFVVNGKLFEFSMEGGKAVSFTKLAEVLHIAEKYNPNKNNVDDVAVDTKTDEGNIDGTKTDEDAIEVDPDVAEAVQNDVLGSTDTEEVSREDIVINDATKEFVTQVEKIEFSNPALLLVEKIEEKTTTGAILSKYDVVPEYPYGITDQEYCDNYMKEFEPIDWVLISLKAFDTPEALTVTMKSGDSFVIEVTDAADAVMVNDNQYGSIAQTITNPSGTTIDLFDYWITDNLRDRVSMNGWPGYKGSGYAFEDYDYNGNRLSTNDPPMSQDSTRTESTWYVQNNHLRGNGNNQGINNGHVFKFYPGAAGTVVDNGNKGSHTNWTNNHDEYSSINSWTGNADPTSGLIQNTLNNEGYPQLTNDASKGTDGSSLSYLFNDKDSTQSGGDYQAGKQKYGGVDNLLYVDSDGYYTYDSRFYSAEYINDENRFILREHSSNASQAQKGFWPFGERVNWHGMHMTTQFSMPTNGQVLNPLGQYKDMQFEFSGDDDTWLFVDGVLVGDGGGIHNRTEIDINFATGKVTVTGKKDPNHPGTTETVRTLYDIFKEVKGESNLNAADWKDVDGDGTPDTFADQSYHTFEMFYLERGGSESNLYIHYNLISTTDFTAHKSYHNTDRLTRDQFKFELIGFDEPSQPGNLKYAIMPGPAVDDTTKLTGWESGAGTVASPKKEHKDAVPGGLDAHTSLIVGVTEDGNVNFGNVQVDASQAGLEYKYMVREVVPEDAVNIEGVRWDVATDEQKLEGGFVKDGITYDGKIYYFKGKVEEKSLGSGIYKVVKTRYKDANYSELDTETKFSNFVNGYVEPLNLKVIKKSDFGRMLSGAAFTLTHALKEIQDNGGSSVEKWSPRTNAIVKTGTTQQGLLTFEGLTEGHYILEETFAPAGYQKGSISKWLLTLTKVDAEGKIILVPSIIPLNEDGTVPSGSVPQELTPDDDYTIAHEVLNSKVPRSDLSVEKKWLKADGTTEYLPDELVQMSVADTVVTGELWRKANTQIPVIHPTVTIYGKNQETSGNGIYLWSGKVEKGSDLSFSVAINATSHPTYTTSISGKGVSYTSSTGSVTYNPRPGYASFSKNGNANIARLSNITEDIDIYADFSDRATDNNIGYSIISRTVPSTTTTSQPLDQKVGDFTLSQENSWKYTWHSADLAEADYDYEYYLKNVSEPSLEGFTFVKNPSITTDGTTGEVTYTVKNIKEGPKTELTVRKVWGDSADHTGDTVKYKILREEFDLSGSLTSGPYEYIAEGDSASVEYVITASDVYDGIAWQKHHSDLPADNGKSEEDPEYRTYKYSVQETSTFANYVVSYTDLDGIKVIINTPTDKRVSVEKKWVDASGNPITSGIPSGAYITGTLKRDYTYQDPAGANVNIYYYRIENGQPGQPKLIRTIENVEIDSQLKIWVFDGQSGNSPQDLRTDINDESTKLANNSNSRTFRIVDSGGSARSGDYNAYTLDITDSTNIYVNWAYHYFPEPAYSTVYFEESHEESAGGGDEHTVSETVGQFRLDSINNWTWSWTNRNLNETEGRTYTYYIVDVEEHTADGTVVTNYEGFSAPVISSMEKGGDQKWYASITNEQEGPQNGSLNIMKAVTADANATEKDFTFDVILKNSNDSAFTGSVKVTDKTRTTATSATPDSNGKITVVVTGTGTATITDIPAGTKYTVTEPTANIPSGWKQDGEVAITGGNADKTIAAGETETATVTNTPTQFEFSKVWKDENGTGYNAWQTDITVTLYRKSRKANSQEEIVKIYSIKDGTATMDAAANESYTAELNPPTSEPPANGEENTGYKYTITGEGLAAYDREGYVYDYYVKESDLALFDTTYGMFTETGNKRVPSSVVDATYATDRGVIINTPKDAYELPSTGGSGTRPIYFLGGMLTMAAGLLLLHRRKRIWV